MAKPSFSCAASFSWQSHLYHAQHLARGTAAIFMRQHLARGTAAILILNNIHI